MGKKLFSLVLAVLLVFGLAGTAFSSSCGGGGKTPQTGKEGAAAESGKKGSAETQKQQGEEEFQPDFFDLDED